MAPAAAPAAAAARAAGGEQPVGPATAPATAPAPPVVYSFRHLVAEVSDVDNRVRRATAYDTSSHTRTAALGSGGAGGSRAGPGPGAGAGAVCAHQLLEWAVRCAPPESLEACRARARGLMGG